MSSSSPQPTYPPTSSILILFQTYPHTPVMSSFLDSPLGKYLYMKVSVDAALVH